MVAEKSSKYCVLFATRVLLLLTLIVLVPISANAAVDSRDLWHDTQAHVLPANAPTVSIYRPMLLDVGRMQSRLTAASRAGMAVSLALPRPDGSFSEFLLVDSRTMPDALKAKYPNIISLAGTDEAGNSVRVDMSTRGFQAMVFGKDGIWVVRPEQFGLGDRYVSFRRSDLPLPGAGFQCEVHPGASHAAAPSLLPLRETLTQTGEIERIYRVAVAANHQYVAAVGGGTVEGGLAAVVQAMNRVNQVYETELGVHMTLIRNNDLIIYADAQDDPYGNAGGALNQNQANLDAVIGSANYDIGHVFTTGSGGVAGLGVTCINGLKARGTTGLPNPSGDAFYIDFVAHEMGHQFGGNHTFNSPLGNCGGGNRAGNAAYEPGSGSTIMAYAGICSSDDLQSHSDPYFHAKSLEEIDNWIEGAGGACTVESASVNSAPVIDVGMLPNGYTIPVHTPFALTASATDAEADSLSYNWEQYDLGPSTTLPEGDTGDGPIFRSFNASTSGTRIFPALATVLGGTLIDGEAWPVTERDLNFRITVRDNHDVPGTPQFGASTSADIGIHVTTSAGPFTVTRPNNALTWGRGETRLVTWDVAATDVAPVSCSSVAISLSTDGGASFPVLLASAQVNDGSTTVLVPASTADSSQARVEIVCENNIFFDVSDVNFSIAEVGDPDPSGPFGSITPSSLDFAITYGDNSSQALMISNGGAPGSSLDFSVGESIDACASTTDVSWLSENPTSGSVLDGNSESVTVSVDTSGLGIGSYAASLCVATNDAINPLFAIAVNLAVLQPANDQIFKDGFDPLGLPPQPVQDPSFEATTGEGGSNPFWTGTDSNPDAGGGTPFYSVAESGVPGHTGSWQIWFGGWGGGAEVQTASQTVTLPNVVSLYINYWRWVTNTPDAAGTLTFSIDGVPVQSIDASGLSVATHHSQHSVDISAFADGGAHVLEIKYEYDDAGGTGEDGRIFIDDVTIEPNAARWLPPSTSIRPFSQNRNKHGR